MCVSKKKETESGIIVVGNLKPWKEINNRYRVLSVTGICATLNSSDYKDARRVVVKKKKVEIDVKNHSTWLVKSKDA